MDELRISTIVNSGDLSPESVRLLREADVDGDGVISVSELLMILSNKSAVEKKNKDLHKLLIVAVIFILLLTGSNLATSILAVHLGKEMTVSSDGSIMGINGKSATTTPVGTTEAFLVESSNETNTVFCAGEKQIDNFLQAAASGTPMVLGLANMDGDGFNEKTVELSSNAFSTDTETCFMTKDGMNQVCFSNGDTNGFCQERDESRRLANGKCAGRRLTHTGAVARHLAQNCNVKKVSASLVPKAKAPATR